MSLTRRQQELTAKVEQLIEVGSTPRLIELYTRKLETVTARQRFAQIDMDCTRAGRQHLADQLARDNLTPGQRQALELRRDTADNLRRARKTQVGCMPPLADTNPDTLAAYNRLGKAREQMAYFDAVTGLNANQPPSPQMIARRVSTEDEAMEAELAYRQHVTRGADRTHLHADEAMAVVAGDRALSADVTRLSHMRASLVNDDAHPPRMYARMLALQDDVAARIASNWPDLPPRGKDTDVTPPPPDGEAPAGRGRSTRRGDGRGPARDRRYDGWIKAMEKMGPRTPPKGRPKHLEDVLLDAVEMLAGSSQKKERGIQIAVPGAN